MAFIVFEGGEGTGKTTQLEKLAEWLRSLGIPCLVTREPGGTPLAEQVRSLFKAVPDHADSPTILTELMLVMAARAQHVQTVVRPALERGEWVLCDRFLDSSYVYQGVRGGLDKRYLDAVAAPVVRGAFPDLTLIFTLDVEAARERMLRRSQGQVARDRLDDFDDAAHRLLNDGFRDLISHSSPWPDGRVPARVAVDAAASIGAIAAQVRAHVAHLLPLSLRRESAHGLQP